MSPVLGVIGTLVWDTIHRHDEPSAPTREWGGIGYALESFSANLPPAWEIVPIMKVGRDLSEEAFSYLARIPRLRSDPGVTVVPEPNNRVELHYREGRREGERLRGGVPGWQWFELEPVVSLCDAIYVNFISGFELELDVATALRVGFSGPLYADLHSLFLGVGREGDRIPQPLPEWARWLRAFDAVQMNEQELHLLAQREGDPWAVAARVVGPDLQLMAVTLEDRGAAYVASAGFEPDPFAWPRLRERLAIPGAARSGHVAQETVVEDGDPTGCGDVWGSTLYARLLGGDELSVAMKRANSMAARNAAHRGAWGLHRHLRGQMASDTEGR